jgi:hypothetical protein
MKKCCSSSRLGLIPGNVDWDLMWFLYKNMHTNALGFRPISPQIAQKSAVRFIQVTVYECTGGSGNYLNQPFLILGSFFLLS